MPKLKFTEHRVAKLKAPDPSGKQVLHWDTDLKGFAVLCSGKSNTKTFVVQRDVNGKARRVTIGPTNVYGVEEARDEAIALIKDMRKGIDPKEQAKSEKAKAVTLRHALDSYLASRKTLRPTSASDYRKYIERYLGAWLDMPLREITPEMVEDRHQSIQMEVADRASSNIARGNSTANGTMRVLRILWNHASERLPELPDNPVKRLRRAWYPEEPRESLVKASDLPAFSIRPFQWRSAPPGRPRRTGSAWASAPKKHPLSTAEQKGTTVAV